MTGMMHTPLVPCPMCGRQNDIKQKACTTCGYAFVDSAEGEEVSVFKRVVGRLTGQRH